MSQWSRKEIDGAFRHFMDVTDRCFLLPLGDPLRDLEEWVQCFTEDVTYRDVGLGFGDGSVVEIHGRDAVRDWICGLFDAFPPLSAMSYPVPWYVIDEERGWVLCEWMNTMEDPGDGSVYEEKSYSRLMYGGNNQWSFEEDIVNPARIQDMMSEWMKAKARCSGEGAR